MASAPTPPGATPRGLSTSEADATRERVGFNEIVERPVRVWRRLVGYLWGPIPWMIEIALVLSGILEHWDDFAIILTLLLVNAVVGFSEEYQASNAVAALKAHLAAQARVLRDGSWGLLPSRELVPGDVVRLRMGDIVPADARLLDGASLELDQSALTGESLPVACVAGGLAYSGAIVQRGEGNARVTSTGTNTFLGRTTQLVAEARTASHLQIAVLRIGDTLIMLALGLAVLIEAVSLVRGVEPLTSLQFALVLTIAAIPVAMPTVLSVTMAVGARSLAAEKAIVSHLEAVEELAGIDVLCSDKTGTLTQNHLTVGDPLPLFGTSSEEVLRGAALASRVEDHDPIDDAILGSPGVGPLVQGFRRSAFAPFDPVRKRTEATLVDPQGRRVRVSKGAPQAILALTGGGAEEKAALDQAVEKVARHGYRALGVARSVEDGPWVYLGVIPLFDPLRTDSAEVVDGLRAMGVQVKMVTGDQAAIARETALQLQLGEQVCVPEDWMGDHGHVSHPEILESSNVFAQVFPEHKYAIVEELQRRGHIVGMTGDGVNDAPALKKADAGIAVSGATDAARAAAAVVLTAPGLGVILTAIRQSRQTFARMTSYAIYRIEETMRLLFFITLSIVLLGYFPVTVIMIVLIALLNDGAILAIAYDRTPFSAKPVSWRMDRVLRVATALGLTGVASSFLLLLIAFGPFHITGGPLQTLIYLKLSVAGHFVIFLTRTEGPFWRSRPASILVASVLGTQTIASLIAFEGWLISPIPVLWIVGVWGYAAVEVFAADLVKQWIYRRSDRGEARGSERGARRTGAALPSGRWSFARRRQRLPLATE